MIRSWQQCEDLGKSSLGRRKQGRGPEMDISLMSIKEVEGSPGLAREKGMTRDKAREGARHWFL